MPRPVARRFQPFFQVLKAIATDAKVAPPLRLRACEMCLALKTGELAFCQGNKAATMAIRKVTAADSVDKQLLELSGLVGELKRETRRLADYMEPEEAKIQRRIDALIQRAAQEKEEHEKQKITN